jgi:hypothetical protein
MDDICSDLEPLDIPPEKMFVRRRQGSRDEAKRISRQAHGLNALTIQVFSSS